MDIGGEERVVVGVGSGVVLKRSWLKRRRSVGECTCVRVYVGGWVC